MRRALLIRAGLRALLAAGLVGPIAVVAAGGGTGAVLAAQAAAVGGATALIERGGALRAARRGGPALRTGLEASLACLSLHAAALVNALLWVGEPGLDLGAKLRRLAAWLGQAGGGPGPVFYLVCLAWLLAGPSGPAAVVEQRRVEGAPRPPLDDGLLLPLHAWSVAFALWVAPPMASTMAGVGPRLVDKLAPAGAVALVTGMMCAMVGALGVLLLCGLDRLADRLAPEA